MGSGAYRVMPNAELCSGSLRLSAVQPDHIERIRKWRNAQMDVLRQSHPISAQDQKRYFEESVWPDKIVKNPKQILLAIEEEGELIGYGGIVHINWEHRRAEVSFLLSEEIEAVPVKRAQVFLDFLKLMKKLSFAELSLNRLTTEIFAHRQRHIETVEAAGYKHEGVLREHNIIDGKYVDSILHAVNARDRCVKE